MWTQLMRMKFVKKLYLNSNLKRVTFLRGDFNVTLSKNDDEIFFLYPSLHPVVDVEICFLFLVKGGKSLPFFLLKVSPLKIKLNFSYFKIVFDCNDHSTNFHMKQYQFYIMN